MREFASITWPTSEIKIVESKAATRCAGRPGWAVYVRTPGQKRGKHVFTFTVAA